MTNSNASVLILTPMKSARRFLDSYFEGLEKLSHPHAALSLGILEGDSDDGTFEAVKERLALACPGFRRKVLVKKDFGFAVPEGIPRFTGHATSCHDG